MILTDEQRQELNGPEPAKAVDPLTKEEYVLVPWKDYERIRPMLTEAVSPPAEDSEIPPGIQRSQAAFFRDLPELLAKKKYHGWWVAYHGDQRIGVSYLPEKLRQQIIRRGIPGDEFYMGVIRHHEPEPEEIEMMPPREFDECDDAP